LIDYYFERFGHDLFLVKKLSAMIRLYN